MVVVRSECAIVRENDSPDSREAKVTGIGRAYAAALLRGDEIAAEIVIREALEAR